MKRLAAALFPLLLAAPAFAELYQWKDENGRVHFSDRKPGNSAGQVNTLQPQAQRLSGHQAGTGSEESTPAAAPDRQQRLLQVMKQEAEQKERERETAQRQQQNREAECNKLRQHQSNIAGRRIFYTGGDNEDGSHRYLDDKQREEYDQQIAAAIAEKCQ